MRFGVKGIGHVATSGTQSREVICQICKSNKLLPGMSQQTQHFDSMAATDNAGGFIPFPGSSFSPSHSSTTDEYANYVRPFRPSS